jgi:hypothetical protein
MTPRTPKRAPEATPGPLAAKSCPSVPLAPVAAGQGDPAAASEHLEALAAAGLDVPEGGAAGEGRSRPPGATPAQGDAEGRKAWQAAISARNAAQRRGRARPRYSADPYAKGTRGARKLPPPKDGA